VIVTCRELTELCTAHKEGRLGLLQRSGIAFHLSWCERCRTYLAQLDLTVVAVKRLEDEAVRPEVKRDLAARFRRAHEERDPER
jgi:hypothetical protein